MINYDNLQTVLVMSGVIIPIIVIYFVLSVSVSVFNNVKI